MRNKPRIVLEMPNNTLAYELKLLALKNGKKGMRELILEAIAEKYPELKEACEGGKEKENN